MASPAKVLGDGGTGKTNAQAVAPEARIPVGALGYMAPGELPEFGYEAMVELHFIDATHLLFAFNIEALLRRSDTCATAETQRKVRATVLAIPSGKVEKQAEWQLFHFADYLWSLGNGEFLLRRCSRLEVVGESLEPSPLIEAASEIEQIGFSPDRATMMVEEKSKQPARASKPKKNPVFGPMGPPPPAVDVAFIGLHPLRMLSRAHLPFPAAVPLMDGGVLEVLAGPKKNWTIDLQPLGGTERKVATVQSACRPRLTPISSSVFLAGVCSRGGKQSFEGYDMKGLLLWRIRLGDQLYYPKLLLTRNGVHFAIESLHANRPLGALDPLSNTVIDGQMLDIYDTATGMKIGSLRITPAYTAGKNADFSPDGARIAVLRDGAIEIYPVNGLRP